MGKVTPEQLRAAVRNVRGRGAADPEGRALAMMLAGTADVSMAEVGDMTVGILAGMELVRRYGVLALDDANLPGLVPAERGPAAQVVLSGVAHRNGMHVAWITRREFEEYLGLGEGELTEQQWMELDDTLTEQQWMELDDTLTEAAAAQVSPYVYVREALKRAGWRAEQISSHELRWVYRPEGWDQS